MDSDKYIKPLNMNGLIGRILRMPTQNDNYNQEILIVYGHHSNLERMSGFAEFFSRYGNVTIPDLPGFGGMDSFYKMNQKPTVDAYADYLAAFVKLKFNRKKVVIIGMSFGVPIYIRMLQKYPKLRKKVKYCVSLVGFVHHEDISLPKKFYWPMKVMAISGSGYISSLIVKKIFLRKLVIKALYMSVASKHGKLQDAKESELKKRIALETNLWLQNDFRTRNYTLKQIDKLDLCDIRVENKMYHISAANDIYFNPEVVSQHMQIIFEEFEMFYLSLKAHAPSVTANGDDIAKFTPPELVKLLTGQLSSNG